MKTKLLMVIALLGTGACAGTAVTRDSFKPIPEHAPPASVSALVRGTAGAAARLSSEQQAEIIAEVVRRFYRPLMRQARWIDPRPLANERTREADSLAKADENRAIVIVEAIGLKRVCPLTEANEQCRGLEGGVLRFSTPYVVGAGTADSALVYARYTPVSYGVEGEIEFFMVRREGKWELASRRNMPVVPTAPVRSDIVDPRASFDELMAADRRFAQAAQQTDLVAAISSMFISNVVMQAPGGHVQGKDAAIAALNANADNKRSRVEWTPVGGGTSSSGQDGFTYGYMTVTGPGGTTQPAKYVAYWVLRPGGWRIAVYRRVPRPAGAVSLAPVAPSLATRALPIGDSATVQRYADELSLAEHAFSREAGVIGLGPAFFKYGAPDAINVGGPNSPEFVRGPDAISKSVAAGITADVTITWAPSQVIVASTGDLGVSIGTIKITAGDTRDVPFFTVWKRAFPGDPWRYIAE